MADTGATMQQAAHTTYQLPSPGCCTRAIQKVCLRKVLETVPGKRQENEAHTPSLKLSSGLTEVTSMRRWTEVEMSQPTPALWSSSRAVSEHTRAFRLPQDSPLVARIPTPHVFPRGTKLSEM